MSRILCFRKSAKSGTVWTFPSRIFPTHKNPGLNLAHALKVRIVGAFPRVGGGGGEGGGNSHIKVGGHCTSQV